MRTFFDWSNELAYRTADEWKGHIKVREYPGLYGDD